MLHESYSYNKLKLYILMVATQQYYSNDLEPHRGGIMRAQSRICALAASIMVAGCAIHPLPEDVTGVDSYTIVRQIRCETRQAIISVGLDWLTDPDNDDRVDPASRAIGLEFKNGTRPVESFRPGLFRGDVRRLIQLFYETGIAYHFELQMTEQNNFGTSLNLLKPFTTSKLTIGIGASANRQRENTRTFALTDSFSGLVRLPADYCDGRAVGLKHNFIVPENYIYPITGKIGVRPLVRDFINLTLFGNLTGDKGAPPTLVDALEFETTVAGNVTPTVTFSPVGTDLRLTDASVTGGVKRQDLHKITMGLSLAGAGKKLVGPVRSALFAPLLTIPAASTGPEQAAAEAVNQALTLKLFRRTVIVNP